MINCKSQLFNPVGAFNIVHCHIVHPCNFDRGTEFLNFQRKRQYSDRLREYLNKSNVWMKMFYSSWTISKERLFQDIRSLHKVRQRRYVIKVFYSKQFRYLGNWVCNVYTMHTKAFLIFLMIVHVWPCRVQIVANFHLLNEKFIFQENVEAHSTLCCSW